MDAEECSTTSATSFAAVFPQIVGEPAQAREVGRIKMIGPLRARGQQLGGHESLQMVTQGGGGQLDVCLDLTGGSPVRVALDDEAQDREAHGMAECTQLLGAPLQRVHALLLQLSK